MRFPYNAYADMVAQERKSYSRQDAKVVADEKQTISESAIEDEDEEISSQLENDDEERSEE